MQNKGIVRFFAIALTLVCIFYLSFSVVTNYYENKAKKIANGDERVEQAECIHYLGHRHDRYHKGIGC